MKNEKNNFILGLTSGIAIVAVIGFVVMSFAYLQKGDSNANDKNNSEEVADAKPSPTPAPTPKPSPSKANITVSNDDHIRGNINAKVTIVEYSDFQCPFCSRFHDTMIQVIEEYPNDVRWVYKHFPLNSHPQALKAAEASECASEQDKFWEYADGLYKNQKSINANYFGILAKELKLDTKKFDECLSSGKYANNVTSDFNQGKSSGVTGTPGGFINGQKLGGAVPFRTLQPMIDNLLN